MIMSDPAIRLFGKTIHIAPNDDVSADLNLCYSTGSVSFQTTSSSSDNNNHKGLFKHCLPSFPLEKKGDFVSLQSNLPPNHKDEINLEFCKSRKSSSSSSSAKSSIISEEQEQEQEMVLKKPSKLLACPRCNSADTKFCYFNNYNAKQPRHFCKGCQRYWTAGGSMRNMAVGAGRRKLKNNPSCTVGGGDTAGGATISFQSYAPIWPNPNCFFPVPVYAAGPYWAWVPPASALGKHPREEEQQSVLAPKTVRFDEASDVAKSSIWSTLGIKSQSLFGGFEKEDAIASSDQRLMLGANPAALSRSLTFRETTAEPQIKLGIN